MVVIGLTGGIATGKSTVSIIFREHGIPVIDADFIAKQVVEPGKPTYRKLRSKFGAEYFDDDNGGVLMREKLAKAIFDDINERRKLNAIIHPTIRWEIMKLFLFYLFTGSKYIVLDVPLLFESGYDKAIGVTIVVWCSYEKELTRLIARDGLTKDDARTRISSQMSIEEKKNRATILIDNNGSKEDLRKEVEAVIRELNASWTPALARIAIAIIIGGITWCITKLIGL